MFTNGKHHKHLRLEMAKRTAETKGQQQVAVVATLHALHEKYFTTDCELDIMQQIAFPIWHSIAGCLSWVDKEAQKTIDMIPTLFCSSLSIRKRAMINQALDILLKKHGESFVLEVALLTLGVRPLTGSLTLSLWDLINRNLHTTYDKYDFSSDYPVSTLTYVDRIAKKPVEIGHLSLEMGERVRCITYSREYPPELNERYLYGIGALVCLGRPIAQFTYRQFAIIAGSYPVLIRPKKISMAKNAEPFDFPGEAIIEIKV